MIKKIGCLFCCLILILSISACQKKDEPAIATLDGENIDEACFKYYFTELRKEMQYQYGEVSWQDATFDGKPALEYVRERALSAAVEDKIITDRAIGDGIELSEEDNQEFKNIKQSWIDRYGSENGFYDEIKSNYGLSSDQFDYMLKAVYYRKHLVKKYVSDEKSLKFYNSNIVKVKHILIPTIELGSNIPLTADEIKTAREKADFILSEVENGKNFDSLVTEYTADQDIFYYIGAGYSINIDGSFGAGMVSEFETASFELEIGEVSGIVESPFGYHIIKRYENDEAMYQISKDNLASIVFTDILEEWKAQKTLVINDSIYNSYN